MLKSRFHTICDTQPLLDAQILSGDVELAFRHRYANRMTTKSEVRQFVVIELLCRTPTGHIRWNLHVDPFLWGRARGSPPPISVPCLLDDQEHYLNSEHDRIVTTGSLSGLLDGDSNVVPGLDDAARVERR